MQEIGSHPNVVTILGVCTEQGLGKIIIYNSLSLMMFGCRALPLPDGVRDVWKIADPLTRTSNEAIFVLQLLQRWRGCRRGPDFQGSHQIRIRCGQGNGVSRV